MTRKRICNYRQMTTKHQKCLPHKTSIDMSKTSESILKSHHPTFKNVDFLTRIHLTVFNLSITLYLVTRNNLRKKEIINRILKIRIYHNKEIMIKMKMTKKTKKILQLIKLKNRMKKIMIASLMFNKLSLNLII